MRKYHLIVFDFDGTLVDTVIDIAYHTNSVMSEFGFQERSLGEIKKAVGLGVHELLKSLEVGFRGKEGFLEEAVLSFKKRYSQKPVIQTRAYPHVEKMLEGPLKLIPKAIVTNKPHELTHQILRELSLSAHFEVVIGVGNGKPPKPDPTATLSVMELLKVSPERTLFVGDSFVDKQTAENANVDFAWVDYGYDNSLKDQPVWRLSSPAQWEGFAI